MSMWRGLRELSFASRTSASAATWTARPPLQTRHSLIWGTQAAVFSSSSSSSSSSSDGGSGGGREQSKGTRAARDKATASPSRVGAWLKGNTVRFSRDARVQMNKITAYMEHMNTKLREELDPGPVGTLEVLKYPHPGLRQHNEPITDFSADVRKTAQQMLRLMYAANGIGLAAPQVGVNQRMMVFNEHGNPDEKESEMVLCNPRITSKSAETNVREEGCLSFPKLHGYVKRHVRIEVEYENVHGVTYAAELSGLPARIFQHEYDHLDKILFIDHFRHRDRTRHKAKLHRWIEQFGEGGAP